MLAGGLFIWATGPYSWSPDGKFVAFRVIGGTGIGVLDLSSKSVKAYCYHGGYSLPVNTELEINGIRTGGDFMWVPDSQQLLVEIFRGSGRQRQDGFGIADLEKGIFVELKWNASFPVWLKQ